MLANKINNNFKVFWRIEFTRLTFKCLYSTIKFSREWGFINHHVWIVKSHVISNWKSIFTYLGLQASWSDQDPWSKYFENHPVTHVAHTGRIVIAIFQMTTYPSCVNNFTTMKLQCRNFEIHKFIISWELRLTQTQFFSDVGWDFFSLTISTWAPP